MQVFKAFFKVLRTKLTMAMIMMAVFIFIAVAYARTSSPTQKAFEDSRLNIALTDNDDTPESRSLIAFIGQKHNIVDPDPDMDRNIDRLYYGHLDCMLTIKKGYAEALKEGRTDDLFESKRMHDSYANIYILSRLDQYVGGVRASMLSGSSLDEAVSRTEELLSKEAKVSYADLNTRDDPEFSRTFSNYFQYMPYILIASVISALSPVLMAMQRREIRYRTGCSCIRSSSYFFKLILGSTAFVAVLWLIYMVVGIFLKGGMYEGKAWFAVLNSLVFSFVCTAMAILIATLTDNSRVVSFLTQILSLGMSFFCGIFVPLSIMGEGIKKIGRLLPAYWYISINDMLCGRETLESSKMISCFVIEALFGIVMAGAALVISRYSRDRI